MSTILPRPKGLIGDLASNDLNDACCWACSGGGDVLCCDGCRAVYHLSCIGMQQLPEDDFFCPLCQCKGCGEPCKSWAHPAHISTHWVEVKHRQMQPNAQSSQGLPSGPGYLCPQQMRSWVRQQSASTSTAATTAARCSTATAAASCGGTAVAQNVAEPGILPQSEAKRHKGEDSCRSSSMSSAGRGTAAAVRCCCCQSACHTSCLPDKLQMQYSHSTAAQHSNSTGKAGRGAKGKKQHHQQQQQQQQQQQEGQGSQLYPEPYFCSLTCRQIAIQMAQCCAQGVQQVGSLVDGTPVSWQLIQPAAVAAALAAAPTADAAAAARAALAAAAPHTPVRLQQLEAAPVTTAVGLVGTGAAARHSATDAAVLAQVLRDVLQLLSQQLSAAWEVRTFQDTLPWLVGGLRQLTPAGLLDLSHCHVAVLWVGSTVAAAALVRVHGPVVLEVCLAATQVTLQHKQLGRALMACVERFACSTLGMQHAWMPALGGAVKPCVGVSLLPPWEQKCHLRDGLVLAPGSSVVRLGLTMVQLQSSTAAAAAAARASDSSGNSEPQDGSTDLKRQNPKDLKACWALQLRYGPAPSVDDWLQLPKYALMRYSYVPFVFKRLSAETLLPLPSFRKKVRAGPAAAGEAKPEVAATTPAAAGGRAPGAAAAAAAAAAGKSTKAGAGRHTAARAPATATADKHAEGSWALGMQHRNQLQQQQQTVQPMLQQFQSQRHQQEQQQPSHIQWPPKPNNQQPPPQPPIQLPPKPYNHDKQQQQQRVLRQQFNFLSAQQLVQMSKSVNVLHSAAAAGGIAAGIAAYNSNKRKGMQAVQQQLQGSKAVTGLAGAGGTFGVGGIML